MRRIFVRMGCEDIFQVVFEWFEMRLGRFVLRLRRSKGDWWFWPTSNSHNHPPYENWVILEFLSLSGSVCYFQNSIHWIGKDVRYFWLRSYWWTFKWLWALRNERLGLTLLIILVEIGVLISFRYVWPFVKLVQIWSMRIFL